MREQKLDYLTGKRSLLVTMASRTSAKLQHLCPSSNIPLFITPAWNLKQTESPEPPKIMTFPWSCIICCVLRL